MPISYDEPEGATLPLFLVRAVLAGQTDRIGSLVVNPGGPGGSGADTAIGLALTLPEQVLQRFDIVGFDPRGVGLSTPVECIPDELKDRLVAADPRPTTDEGFDEVFSLADEVAAGCADEYGDALGTFNTVDTARDMDRLRQALGDEQLTYLGYSYGTTLGSTYAELFPDRVRALVLDGAVDPDVDPQAKAEASAAAFESGFDVYAENCTGPDRRLPARRRPARLRRGRPDPGRGRADPEQRGGRDAARDAGRRPDRRHRGAVRHRLLAAADAGADRGPRRATPPGSSRSPTATPAGSTTTPTRTCSTPTSRSTARTPRRPTSRTRSATSPRSGTPSTRCSAPVPR